MICDCHPAEKQAVAGLRLFVLALSMFRSRRCTQPARTSGPQAHATELPHKHDCMTPTPMHSLSLVQTRRSWQVMWYPCATTRVAHQQ